MTPTEQLHDAGCVLLRGAIPEERVIRYRSALENIYRESHGNGDVAGNDFDRLTELRMRDLFSSAALEKTAKDFLGTVSPFNSTFMSVSVNAENSSRGLCLHTDGIIQGTSQSVLCMWAPLHPCGESAPGLAVVRAGKDAVLKYLRRHFPSRTLPGWHSADEWNSTAAFIEEAVRAELGEPWRPVMSPGDVMLFTNWTIHGSHITPNMSERRSAAIYRLTRKNLLQRLGDYEFQFLGRRRALKSWVRSNIA